MNSTQVSPVTVREFERRYLASREGDRLLELIHGEVYEKIPTEEHGIIAGNLVFALKLYAKKHGGRVGVEVRHRILSDEHNSRLPDVSYTRTARKVVTRGSVPEMPELAVEIKSPDDTIKEMRETAAYYLTSGARLVWLVFPHKKLVEVYQSDADVEILTTNDRLTGGGVLQGFDLPVSAVFADLE